jgi:hypothetical protein
VKRPFGAAAGACCRYAEGPPADDREAFVRNERAGERQTFTPKSWAMPTRPEA